MCIRDRCYASAAGRGFAQSGGVAKAVADKIKEWRPDMVVKIASAQGLADCKKLLMPVSYTHLDVYKRQKQHRGDLEHELLIEPFVHVQVSFFIQRKIEIRVIQIPVSYTHLGQRRTCAQ